MNKIFEQLRTPLKKIKGAIIKLCDLNPYERGKIITALNRNKQQLQIKLAKRKQELSKKTQIKTSKAPAKKKIDFQSEIISHVKKTMLKK